MTKEEVKAFIAEVEQSRRDAEAEAAKIDRMLAPLTTVEIFDREFVAPIAKKLSEITLRGLRVGKTADLRRHAVAEVMKGKTVHIASIDPLKSMTLRPNAPQIPSYPVVVADRAVMVIGRVQPNGSLQDHRCPCGYVGHGDAFVWHRCEDYIDAELTEDAPALPAPKEEDPC